MLSIPFKKTDEAIDLGGPLRRYLMKEFSKVWPYLMKEFSQGMAVSHEVVFQGMAVSATYVQVGLTRSCPLVSYHTRPPK